jgi:ATP-dependent Clp protease ATP-binding subunit ClpB
VHPTCHGLDSAADSAQRSLSRRDVMRIVDIRLKELQERLADRKMLLELDDNAKHYLGSIGYSPTYGARPLNRVIQQELLHPLSVMMVSDPLPWP